MELLPIYSKIQKKEVFKMGVNLEKVYLLNLYNIKKVAKVRNKNSKNENNTYTFRQRSR